MAGLVPAIRAAESNHVNQQLGAGGNSWMPGSSLIKSGHDGLTSEQLFGDGSLAPCAAPQDCFAALAMTPQVMVIARSPGDEAISA